MDKPVYFSDLVDCRPIASARMSEEERREFIRRVEMEMDRLGFTRANDITAQSEILTERDYATRVNI